jgi:transcriptional regulator with XRE-family HTH domain
VPSRSGSARVARLLGRRIKALREERGLGQEELAWSCDLSKSHLSQIEAGRGYPSVPVLLALAKGLGVSPLDLLACDPDDARGDLLDAVRKGDRELALRALRSLGLR